MAPPPEPSPEVAVVLVVDRYIIPSTALLIVPLLQAINDQYPRSKIRLASVTYDTMTTNELLVPVHWFTDYETFIKPNLQNTSFLMNRFGLRPSSAPKGKGALLEGLVQAMELLDMHTAQPFDVSQQPSAKVEVSHTRLRSFKRQAKPGSTTPPPVHYVIALCTMHVDTGARAMKNRNPEFDGCTWGALPSKLKERSIFLSLLSTTPSEKLVALHKETTSNPIPPWWVLHPQFGSMQRLLAGYDTRVNASALSKRGTSDPEPDQSPSAKRARTSNPPHPQPSQPDLHATTTVASSGLQAPASMPSARANGTGQAPSIPSGTHSALRPPQGQQQPASRAAVRQQPGRPLTLPPLPQPGLQLNAMSTANAAGAGASQAAPGTPPTGTGASNNGNVRQQEWATLLQINSAYRLRDANGAGVPARPNSVAAGGVSVKPTQTGGHSRSTSLQGAPPFMNGVQPGQSFPSNAPGSSMSMPDQQANLQAQTMHLAPNQSNSSPFPPHIAGASNGMFGQNMDTSSSMPAGPSMRRTAVPGQHAPSQQAWQPPPTPRPFPVDLNDRQSVKTALDICCKEFLRQLHPTIQTGFLNQIQTHVTGTTSSEDILKSTANTLASVLLQMTNKTGHPRFKQMHDRLLELSRAYWVRLDQGSAGSRAVDSEPPQPMPQSMQMPSSSPPQPGPTMGLADMQERQRAFVQKQQVHLQRQDQKLAQQTTPQQAAQARPQAPPTVQMQPGQLGRNAPGSGVQNNVGSGQQMLGNVQGSPAIPVGQNIPRPPTTQPPLLQNQQQRQMQVPQQLPQQALPQQFQSQQVVQHPPTMPPANPSGTPHVPQQNGSPEKLIPPHPIHQAFLAWKAPDNKEMLVLTGLSILKAAPDRAGRIIEDVKAWPQKLFINEWRPCRREDLTKIFSTPGQHLVSFSVGLANHPKMTPPQIDHNIANWNLLCGAFGGGSKAAIVRINPSPPTSAMVLFSLSHKMTNRLVGFWYQDTPIPDFSAAAGSASGSVGLPPGSNAAALQNAAQQHLAGRVRPGQSQMTPAEQRALEQQVMMLQQRAHSSVEATHQQNQQRQVQQPQQSQVQPQQQRPLSNFGPAQGAMGIPMMNMSQTGSDLANRNQQAAFMRQSIVQQEALRVAQAQAQARQAQMGQGNQDLGTGMSGMSVNAAFQNMFQQQSLNPQGLGQQNLNAQNFNMGNVGMGGLAAGGSLPPPPFGQGQLGQHNLQQSMQPQQQQSMMPLQMPFMTNANQQQQGSAGQSMPLEFYQQYMKNGEGRPM